MLEITNRVFISHSTFNEIPRIAHTLKTQAARIGMLFIDMIKIFAQVALFHHFHLVAAAGFISGIIWDEKTQEIKNKVNVIYNSFKTTLEKCLFFGGGGFLSLYLLPVTFFTVTFYQSAQWGYHFYQNRIKKLDATS